MVKTVNKSTVETSLNSSRLWIKHKQQELPALFSSLVCSCVNDAQEKLRSSIFSNTSALTASDVLSLGYERTTEQLPSGVL